MPSEDVCSMSFVTLLSKMNPLGRDNNKASLDYMLRAFQQANYPKSVQYIPKTKRPCKVHFVWADSVYLKCEVVQNEHTLYSKWAPDVTCAICRQMMYNRGITQIL